MIEKIIIQPDDGPWLNAHLTPGLDVRVGIPAPSGKLAFHAFQNEYKTMVSAQAFWNASAEKFRVPSASDLFETDFALDSAGYTAMMLWGRKGRQKGMANVYPWSYTQYLELASELRPDWYSAVDLCCEPLVAANDEVIDYRIDATATLLEGCLRVLYAWSNELAKSCSETVIRNLIKPPVPVVQGWRSDQYQRSLDLTLAVWERWQPWLAPPALIGVGSVCRREIGHPTHGLFAILDVVERSIPPGSRLHLFGVKGTAIDELKMRDAVASTDSMAYDWSARRKAFNAGASNTYLHRSEEMSRWMGAALKRAAPSPGDQFRLF